MRSLRAPGLLSSTVATGRRQAGAVSPANPRSILSNNLRLLLLALAIAFGFSTAQVGCFPFPHSIR